MKLSGTIDIAADPRRVWELVVDPTSLAACVPGVRDMDRVDDRTFTGSIRASVGPMEGDFTFTAVLEQAVFPDDLVVKVTGLDSVTKSRLEMDATIVLSEPEAGRTQLAYRSNVAVKGRLAILGEMVLRATAGMMIGQVTRCIRDRLEVAA